MASYINGFKEEGQCDVRWCEGKDLHNSVAAASHVPVCLTP